MAPHPVLRAVCAGVLTANALPHAYAAAVGAQQLTPLRGRGSGPATNAVWAGINATAAASLMRRLDPRSDSQRRAFKAGVVVFAAWVWASEWLTDLNG